MIGFESIAGVEGTADSEGSAGIVAAAFSPDEAELLRTLCAQLIGMLADRSAESVDPGDLLLAQLGIGGPSSAPLDPALARLLPDAYRGDTDAASEHRHLTERGLVDRKVANAQTVLASLQTDTVSLKPAAVQAWLRTLTDLRLTIAARLEIESDADRGRHETDSDRALQSVYEWLGYAQGTLVEALE